MSRARLGEAVINPLQEVRAMEQASVIMVGIEAGRNVSVPWKWGIPAEEYYPQVLEVP